VNWGRNLVDSRFQLARPPSISSLSDWKNHKHDSLNPTTPRKKKSSKPHGPSMGRVQGPNPMDPPKKVFKTPEPQFRKAENTFKSISDQSLQIGLTFPYDFITIEGFVRSSNFEINRDNGRCPFGIFQNPQRFFQIFLRT
jgi:hypothetical protein